jgi:hypothetical protein
LKRRRKDASGDELKDKGSSEETTAEKKSKITYL